MKKKYLGIFTLMIAVILVNGQACETGDSRTTGEAGNFMGGIEGLVVEFLNDAPAASGNFKGDPIPVELTLINRGEEDVASQHIYIKGALASITDVNTQNLKGLESNEKVSNVMLGKLEEGDEGLIEQDINIDLGSFIYTEEIPADSVPVSVVAEVCYPYKTKLQVNELCMPSKSTKIVGEPECEVDASANLIVEGHNSGAPVQIDTLRESKLGRDSLRLTLNINNQGAGRVVQGCAREPSEANLDVVRVEIDGNYDCFEGGSNSGFVTLREGTARVTCTKPIQETGNAFVVPFKAKLSYDYIQEVSKTISINDT